jgi:hypothetical protein
VLKVIASGQIPHLARLLRPSVVFAPSGAKTTDSADTLHPLPFVPPRPQYADSQS